jgi:hypothetical protein
VYTSCPQDHGKSSLASRILEYTGNLGKEKQSIAWRGGGGGGEENDGNGNDDDDGGDDGTNNATSSSTGGRGGGGRDDAMVGAVGQDTNNSDENDVKEEIFVLDTLAVERERGITVKGVFERYILLFSSSRNNCSLLVTPFFSALSSYLYVVLFVVIIL